MSSSITHARIMHLLEVVERTEKGGTLLSLDALTADEATAKAELDWLAQQELASFVPDGSAVRASLTPGGRGTLALMRGEA